MTNPRVTMKRFATAVKGTGGIQKTIAERLNVSRQHINIFIKNNPEAKEMVLQEEESMIDMAESSLMKQIEKDEAWATKFLLATKGKKRGYTEKHEIEHSGFDDVQINFIVPYGKEVIDVTPNGKESIENNDKTNRETSGMLE